MLSGTEKGRRTFGVRRAAVLQGDRHSSGLANSLNLRDRIQQAQGPLVAELLRTLGATVGESALPLYLVGGPVRDLLLGRSVVDLDLVVEGDAALLAHELAKGLAGQVVAYSQFDTAKLRIQGHTLDLTTARRETYRHPGALPTVTPGTLDDDLRRRDFTINAMAVHLSRDRFGDLVDPLGGLEDVRRGHVQVLHDNSFVDDATRILRAIRYEQRLGFSLEERTADLLRRHLGYLDTISPDRVRHELERILEEPNPARALSRAHQLGALAALHPALRNTNQVQRPLAAASGLGKEATPLLFLGLLAWPVPRPETEGLIGRLNLTSRQAKVLRDAQRVRELTRRLAAPKLRPSHVYGLLEGLAPEAVLAGSLASTAPKAKERLRRYLQEWRLAKPCLTGHDLLALGVPQGPAVGQLLAGLKRAILDGAVSSRQEEESLVRRYLTGDIATRHLWRER